MLYPVSVLLLILVFWQRLEIAAAVWGILAFGDGMATLVGQAFGRRKLPWNPRKSWAGSLSYLAFGSAAAATLLLWTAPGRYEVGFALAIAGATALAAALVESLPIALDDNLGVPLLAGLLLFCLSLTAGRWESLVDADFLRRFGVALVVNLVLSGAALAVRGVDRSGAVVGTLLGTALWTLLGWQGFTLLFAFFALGTAATKVGYEAKARARLAQEKGGRRGARNALAKTTVPVLCALFAATTPHPGLFALAAAAAFATAAADTVSSEIGQVYGRRTFLLTTLRPVPRGTQGAVSLEGTLAGLAAALAVAGLGAAVGLYPLPGVAIVTVAALVATTLESLLGATLEKRGLLDNESVNFLNTLFGALAAAALHVLAMPHSSAMKKLDLYAQLARPFTLLPPLLGIVSGAVCAFGSVHNPDPSRAFTLSVLATIALGSLCASFLNAASNAINQIYDLEIDRVNKPERPLCTGALSLREAWGFTWLFYALALVPTWLVVVYPHTSLRPEVAGAARGPADLLHLPRRRPLHLRLFRSRPRPHQGARHVGQLDDRGAARLPAQGGGLDDGGQLLARRALVHRPDLHALPGRGLDHQGLRRHPGRPRRRLQDAADPPRPAQGGLDHRAVLRLSLAADAARSVPRRPVPARASDPHRQCLVPRQPSASP